MLKNRSYAVGYAHYDNNLGYDPRNYKFTMIPNGLNYWVADPFPIEVNGELYIFGEMYEYSSLKGSICYSKKTENGFGKWVKIIEEPYHLSFPYIFQRNGCYYICPEARQSKQLYLYRCLSFPDVWERERTICEDFDYVDTVFVNANKDIIGLTCKWKNLNEHSLKMFMFNEDKDKIEFSMDKLNTLEFYFTRPAGKVFNTSDNKMILVSQICKPLYGSGLIFKRIQVDFPKYSEMELFKVYPNEISSNIHRRIDGIHTYNYSPNYIVIDLLWSRFNICEKAYRIKHKFRK